jgi:Mrp family chromosome partitioning ATPase/capsular polysaccharide biosynthesis protein
MTVGDYMRVLRSHRLLVVLTTLVAAGAAFGLSAAQDPVYESHATLVFGDESRQLAILGTPVPSGPAAGQTPQARAQTIVGPQTLGAARKSLGAKRYQELAGKVSAAVDPKSGLVNVTATSRDAAFSSALANKVAKAAADQTNSQTRARYRTASRSVRLQLRRINRGAKKDGERLLLTDELSRLRFLGATVEPAEVVSAAQKPAAPVSPKPVRNTILGALAGLALGILLAFLRDSLDRRLRDPREIQEELDYPLVGFVRSEALRANRKAGKGQGRPVMSPLDLEGFRIIRQNLQFLAVDKPMRTVVVTSPLPQEGKSTVAASLAIASAAAGKRTLLVECDLRRPALGERLGLEMRPGLTDYLAGNAEPEEILQPVEAGRAHARAVSANGNGNGHMNGNGNGAGPSTGHESEALVVITAGSPSPQPAELLGSKRFEAFLDEVAEVYDLVLIDSSPLLPVADTLELLPHVDGVLLCVRSSQTTVEQARGARAALEHFPERPTALVVTGVRQRDEALGYGSYAYSYAYASHS